MAAKPEKPLSIPKMMTILNGVPIIFGGAVHAFGVENKLQSLLKPIFPRVNKGGLDGLVVIGGGALLMWLGFECVNARVKYSVQWPDLYAPAGHKDAHIYNCIQRAHQHTLEGYPQFLMVFFLASQDYPITSALCGVTFLASRYVAAKGYQSGDVKNRQKGAFGYAASLTLNGLVIFGAATRLGWL